MPDRNPHPEGTYLHAWWEADAATRELGRQLAAAFTPVLQQVADAMARFSATLAQAGTTVAAFTELVREAERRREVRRGYQVGFALVLFMGLLLWVVARGA